MIDQPKVLINCDHTISEEAWYRSNYNIPVSYCDIFAKNNIIILSAIPAGYNLNTLKALVSVADGYVFIGGGDYPSEFLGYERTPHESPMSIERARNDVLLFREAWNTGKPILGICDGIQLASLALGGKVVPHIEEGNISHASKPSGEDSMHPVTLSPCRLSTILGRNELVVNSSHHQSVDPDWIPEALQIVGKSEDGVVEAMERRRKGFGLFTQWHPERHPDKNHTHRIFTAFINALRQSFEVRKAAIGARAARKSRFDLSDY